MSLINRFFSDTLASVEACDVIFICHDVDRGASLNGKAYSPLVDSIRNDFEKRGLFCLSLQYPWSEYFGPRGHGNPLCMNRSYLISKLKHKLCRLFLGVRSNKTPSNSIVNIYSRIIAIAKPKCIICIGAPTELCLAANQHNVLVVELLHGIGYTFVPWGYDARSSNELPDFFLSLDHTSTKTFSTLGKLGKSTYTIPHPFLKRFVNPSLRSALPKEWHPRALPNPKIFKKEILFSLQWGYSGDHGKEVHFENILENGLFPNCIMQLISDNDSVSWRFRLHPVQLRLRKYAPLVKYLDRFCKAHKNCEWKDSTYLPLPAVLATCDGHISMISMTAYEAAYMGVPSLMLCPTLQPGGLYEKYFLDLEAAHFVTKAPIDLEIIRSWVACAMRKAPLDCALGDEAAWERAVSLMLGETKASPTVANI